MSSEHFDPDSGPCNKCGARSYQLCNRYRLQRPIICPRDAMPLGERLQSPDASLGAELCYEALGSTLDRFEPGAAPLAGDGLPTELDFDTDGFRRRQRCPLVPR